MNRSGTSFRIRQATADDEHTLWLMLTFAASMADGGAEEVPRAKADAYLRTYVEEWGRRDGDVGVVALDETGRSLGATWLRLKAGHGEFSVGTAAIPELATAVRPECRGRGVGTLMMKALIEISRKRFNAIELSVRETNRAATFYGRFGFRETGRLQNRVGGASLVLRLDLR